MILSNIPKKNEKLINNSKKIRNHLIIVKADKKRDNNINKKKS